MVLACNYCQELLQHQIILSDWGVLDIKLPPILIPVCLYLATTYGAKWLPEIFQRERIMNPIIHTSNFPELLSSSGRLEGSH